MATLWRASGAVPVRVHPDAAEPPTGRLNAGSAVEEIDRLGGWVRVQEPDGERWWVDGRRLEDASLPATGEATPPTDAKHRRLPVLVLATALAGVAALIAGVVLLVTRADPPPEPPTALTQVVTLDVSPKLLGATRSPSAASVWFSDGATVSQLDGWGSQLNLGQQPGDGDVDLTGAVAITGDTWDLIVAYGDGTAVHWDELDDRRDVVRLPVGDGVRCCAPSIAWDGSNRVDVFPIDAAGRSDTMWIVDFGTDTVTSISLPSAGTVRDALSTGSTVLVALDTGLVAVGTTTNGSCHALLGQWELSASALWRTSWPDVADRVLALDPEAGTITVLDPWGWVYTTGACRAGDAPEALGTVDLASAAGRPLSLGASLAAVDQIAYVLTTSGELVIVDVSEPTVVRNDRYVDTVEGLVSDDGTSNRLAVIQTVSDRPARVLVADPEFDGFWVIGEGNEGTTVETIDLRQGSR